MGTPAEIVVVGVDSEEMAQECENFVNEYAQRVVAFLDILGFRAMVRQEHSDVMAVIRMLEEGLSHVVKVLKSEDGEFFSVKLFSDCLSISCHRQHMGLMLRELSWLQLFLVTRGVFVSGAVAEGLHYESERMLFSEALITAYELQTCDRLPRILIAEPLASAVKHECCSLYGEFLAPLIAVAPDGQAFVDYIQAIVDVWQGLDIADEMKKHRQEIVKEVLANRTNHRVLQKYKWLAEYHNHKFHSLFLPDEYYEDYYKELGEEILIREDVFPQFRTNQGRQDA